MSAPTIFQVETPDEAFLFSGTESLKAPDDCDCPGTCVCAFDTRGRSTD